MAATMGKRKWTEMDWEVVMEAQSFVAVYAEGAADDEPPAESKPKGKKASNPKSKKKSNSKSKPKPARRSGRKTKAVQEEEDEEEKEEEKEVEEANGGAEKEAFWLAELRDDVTEDMLATDVGVHVRWLNKRGGSVYEYAFDDVVEVQTLLCHVYMVERADGTLELTAKSLARVERCVRRTRGEDIADEMDEDDEKPPPSRRKKRAVPADVEDDGEGGTKRRRGGGGGGGRGGGGGAKAKKLSKREEAMHIPPKYATVSLSKYEDTEIRGSHAFQAPTEDMLANAKEVIRAVVAKNTKLLKKLAGDKNVYKSIHSFAVPHGADVKKTALQYAVEADDLASAALLLKARKLEKKQLAKKPETSLPSHSTGKHTSSYSDYNRRAINASRGGREGNNALVEDGDTVSTDEEDKFLWGYNKTSVKMLTLFYPTGEWSSGYSVAYNVARACRAGNYKLANKVIETLQRNGGWGFNELHAKVLSDSDEDLPVFRSVSAIKQAYQTKIRPIHLAAINPNTKYLEAMWDSAGDEWSSAKDDLAFEPIHFAAACESTGPLAFLLERRCNMFARTKRRQTPIMRAIATGREDNAIFLMDKASEESQEVLSKIVSERGPGSFQPVHYAARYNCHKVLEHLLKNGADINSVCEGKLTPLCLAAREGHYDCVKVLLDHGAKINQGDKLKKTPLILAVKNGRTRIAALLINGGANVNAFDTSENSVVHYAASYGWKSCLELLADAGADFWAKNSWGFVPLTCALLKQRLLCSKYILEHDPNQQFLDFRDRQGCTMLFLQCSHSTNASQIKYLLDKGLNPNIPNSDNVYPLQVLLQRAKPSKTTDGDEDEADNFYVGAIRLLLEHKAAAHYDIEVKKPIPGLKEEPVAVLQPLQIAIQRDLKDIFLLLLNEYDADPSKQGSDGLNAWMTAIWKGRAGEFFLEELLKNHTQKNKNKNIDLSARDIMGDNVFHCVGAARMDKLIAPSLIRELIKKCQDPAFLMNQKNDEGLTPLQKLLEEERDKPSKDISLPEHADLLEEIEQADTRYSTFVEIFAHFAKHVDAWVKFVDEKQAKHNVDSTVVALSGDTSDSEDDEDTSKTGSDSEGDEGEEDEVDEEDEEDADEDSEDEEEEEENDKVKKRPNAPDSPGKGPRKLVPFESILHWAANRQLRSFAKKASARWYGSNLISILLKHIQFDEATINFADFSSGKTALDYAVEHGDEEGAAALLKSGADPNNSPVKCDACSNEKIPCVCPRDLIDTSLVVAVRSNNVDLVRLLLQSGRVDLNCFEKGTLNRPLHLSLAANNAGITAILLEHKADLTKINAAGSTALHLAVHARHSVIAKQPHEGEVEYTNFESTEESDYGSLSAISVALLDDQAKHVVMSFDANKRTPVHVASLNRDLELLRALVGASANKKLCVNKADRFGRTPLHFAVNASSMNPDASFEVERFLLQSGADANAVDHFKFSALHFALFKVDLDWHTKYDTGKDKAEAIREREAGTYESNKSAAFLKVLAKIPSNETDPVETVSNLTSIRGINTLIADVLGRTPLHLAAATGAFVCASSLLSIHSNQSDKSRALALTDNDQFTPLGRAVEHLRQTTIMTLLQNGAQVDGLVMLKEASDKGENEDSQTAKVNSYSYFYHAVKNSLTGICHMLLNAKFSKRQAVEDAILCGQFQLASNLMVGIKVSSGNALLSKPSDTGDTLLHSLARVNKPFDDLARSIAWSLVDSGLKADSTNDEGCSPLHYAAELGNIHLIDFLLHNKCNINQANKAGETPVIFAVKRSTLGIKRVLQIVKYFADRSSTDLHAKDTSGGNLLSALIDRFVSTNGHLAESFFEWVETLLKKGVNSNELFTSHANKDFFNNEVFGSSKTTQIPPIIRAVYAESSTLRCSLLGLLLRYGAKVNTADSNGNSLLMHLAAGNKIKELNLAIGKTKTIRDPVDNKSKKVHSVHVPAQDVKLAVAQTNKAGQTVLHIAVKPVAFGSFENTQLLELLISSGASLQARDKDKKTPVDYTMDQASRFLYRYLHEKYPKFAPKGENEVFDDFMEEWEVPPNYTIDADAYITECEKNGKITKTRVHPEPNANCDVGSLKRVYGQVDSDDKVISGEEYDALLTKVDVKNGRFGLNVFYRCQIVHDQIQGIYVVFTNWGRIGEEGKFQNTPFHSIDDAVTEFKKIFRSKTGNHWHERHDFVKHNGKYNLVQRANYHTKLSDEITMPIVEAAEKTSFVASKRGFATSVTELLFAITDVRNLQLAATENAKFDGSLPLANSDELRAAVDRLVAIREVIETRDKLSEEMQKVRGDMSDGAASQLADLSKQHSDLTEDVSEKSSRYYEIMPCNEDEFGSSIKAFNSVSDVNTEITRLRMLIDITHTYKMLLGSKKFQHTVHPLDYCYDALQVNISPLPLDSDESILLKKWFFGGVKPYERKQYRISNVFEISRNGEKTRFNETLEAKTYLKSAHTQLLWHGTKRTNLMGILSQGLRIAPPEAPHHGYMYGKGLYFANVAAKSLAYCDSGYTIISKSKDADGNEVKKTRRVHYLLACQVALGSPMELTSPIEYGKNIESVESVRAVGRHVPDPSGAIVSPLSGAALPLGRVGEVGVAFPFDVAWAKTGMSKDPWMWYLRSPSTSPATLSFWDKLVEEHAVGETYQVEAEAEQKLFFPSIYGSTEISVEIVSKDTSSSGESSFCCDAVIKITVKPSSYDAFSWQAKRVRNAYVSSPLGDGFELIQSTGPEYDELIVYDEGQARIRYLVEVESLLVN